MIKLIGVLIVIVGFALRFNPIAIVMAAGFITSLVGGMSLAKFFEVLGSSFVANRYMAFFMLILPVVGILERNGLKITAGKCIGKIKNATPGKIIMTYGIVRTALSAFNVSFGGVAGFVRPVVYPMAVGSIEKEEDKIDENDDEEIKAMCGAIENVAWFFGQVLFIAGAGILLVKGTLESQGYSIVPLECVKAEVPVVIAALIVTGIFFMIIDKKIIRKLKQTNKNN